MNSTDPSLRPVVSCREAYWLTFFTVLFPPTMPEEMCRLSAEFEAYGYFYLASFLSMCHANMLIMALTDACLAAFCSFYICGIRLQFSMGYLVIY